MWDLAADHRLAAPEPEGERFNVFALAFSSDGRTLAAAGHTDRAEVRLYDLARDPAARRAVLTFDEPGANQKTDICSDLAFTPDGRRVAAVGMHKVRIWDAATGDERVAFDRLGGSSSDRLAVSPDGRWMAITSPFGAGVSIIDIPAEP